MKNAALEKLASKHVGDGKTSLIFVTDDQGVLAVFNGSFLPEAKRIANSFGTPCWVETKDGVEYDNPAARLRQRDEEAEGY